VTLVNASGDWQAQNTTNVKPHMTLNVCWSSTE